MTTPALMNNGFNQMAKIDATTAVLTASGTYTTANALLVGGNARITGTVFADQAGTLNIDQSSDGTNWDYSTSVTVTASTKTNFSVEVVAPYARLRYVNGATIQTVFRLYAFTRGV